MARTVYQYQPINERPDVAVGLLLPLNKAASRRFPLQLSGSNSAAAQNYDAGNNSGNGVFVQSYTTEEQSVSNLTNLLLTTKGERFMQPQFGTDIQTSLFEPNTIDLEESLVESLTNDINFWLPYIDINGIDVSRDVNAYTMSIRVRFKVSRTGANLVINILASENDIQVSQPIVDDSTRLVGVGTF